MMVVMTVMVADCICIHPKRKPDLCQQKAVHRKLVKRGSRSRSLARNLLRSGLVKDCQKMTVEPVAHLHPLRSPGHISDFKVYAGTPRGEGLRQGPSGNC